MGQDIKIGWVSFHLESVPALEALLKAGHNVDFLVTLEAEAMARRSGTYDFSAICEEHGIAMHRVRHIDDPDSIEFMRAREPDLLVILGWSQILGDDALAVAGTGVVGAHASMLPHNRGSAPVNWAIINGETETGNSLMWLDAGVDSGNIIDQRAIAITPYDTCATIYDRVAETNALMMLDLVAALKAGERPGAPQVESDEALLPRRKPADGLMDWTQGADRLYDFVRALTRPYPGAFTEMAGRRFLVWKAALPPADLGGSDGTAPGMVLGPVLSTDTNGCGLAVACGDGALILLELEDAETGKIHGGSNLAELPWTGQLFEAGMSEHEN